jgi:hypothetical protein
MTLLPLRHLLEGFAICFGCIFPGGALSNELGNVTALKVGCGTGVYGRLLETCLGHSFKQYVDVDIEAQEH